MLFGFGYLYKFATFCFFFFLFFQKAENNRLKKASCSKFCNIIFLFLLKIGLVGSDKLTCSRLSSIYLEMINLNSPHCHHSEKLSTPTRLKEGVTHHKRWSTRASTTPVY